MHLDILRYKGRFGGRTNIGAICIRHVVLAGYARCEYGSSECDAIPSDFSNLSEGGRSRVNVIKSWNDGTRLIVVKLDCRITVFVLIW